MKDRMFYTIESHLDGKFVHYLSFFAGVEGMVDVVELCWAYLPATTVADDLDAIRDVEERSKQYARTIDEDEADRLAVDYYGNDGGTYMPIAEVSENTPCGNYWCFY